FAVQKEIPREQLRRARLAELLREVAERVRVHDRRNAPVDVVACVQQRVAADGFRNAGEILQLADVDRSDGTLLDEALLGATEHADDVVALGTTVDDDLVVQRTDVVNVERREFELEASL